MFLPILRQCLGALIAGGAVCAQAATFQANVTILRDDIVYEVQEDGRFVVDEFEVLRINSEQGVKERGQAALGYSASLQELEVLEAYTTTKDGRRVDVPADKIMLQQSPQSAGAPTFDDGKVKTVVFPALEVGATVTLHTRRTQKTPLFPGHFTMLEGTSPQLDYESERITVKAPARLKLYVDARGLEGGQTVADQNGQQVWQWTLKKQAARAPEMGAIGAFDFAPRVAVSTFADYEAVAKAYQLRAKPKATASPAIRKLADEITAGIGGRREQAEALYRWVSNNIRYVAIFLDFGGVVPHAADEIAAARYGDCKDHTTLLEALLSAKGIQSSPVLVNAGDAYSLPTAALPTGVFNHAISYLPEFKLFVDSTPGLGMFGVLPIVEQGKTALVIDAGDGQARLMQLPVAGPETDRVSVRTQMQVDADGSIQGQSKVSQTGAFDLLSRMILGSLPKGVEPQVAAQVLTLTGQSGSGNFHLGTARDLTQPYAYGTEFKLPNAVQLPGPGALMVPPGLGSFSGIGAAFEAFAPEQRSLPMVYAGRQVNETITLALPEGVAVAALPKPVSVQSPFGEYSASFKAEGRNITIARQLRLNVPGQVLKAEDYPAMRKMAAEVMRDLRRQLVY